MLKILSTIKDAEFGELILEKAGNKVWFVPYGANLRYTINKELQVDVNVFNSEVYMHLKRKFPKAGRGSDALSIRAGCLSAIEFILAHASEKLLPQIQGKNIDPNLFNLAQKLMQMKQ